MSVLYGRICKRTETRYHGEVIVAALPALILLPLNMLWLDALGRTLPF